MDRGLRTWNDGHSFERSQDTERPQGRQVAQIDAHRHVPEDDEHMSTRRDGTSKGVVMYKTRPPPTIIKPKKKERRENKKRKEKTQLS